MYLRAKSIPRTNKLVSFANGYKQMLIVLKKLEVSHSILIGLNKYTCQSFDQKLALLQIGPQMPKYDHI